MLQNISNLGREKSYGQNKFIVQSKGPSSGLPVNFLRVMREPGILKIRPKYHYDLINIM